ncbi:MAG: DUF1189 family protein [Bdellovibrionales bacterium]
MIQMLKSLPLTFYSAPFYRQFVKKGKGIGLGYMFIVALLSLLVMAAHISFTDISVATKKLFNDMPEITLTDGTLSMAAPSPYAVTFLEPKEKEKTESGKEESAYHIVFDMKTDEAEEPLLSRMRKEKILILVTPTKLVLDNPSQNKTQIRSFDKMEDFTLTHEDWVRMGDQITSYLAPVMALPVLGVLFLQSLISVFFVGGLFLLFSMISKHETSLAAMMRLAAAAKIPVVALSFLVPPEFIVQTLLWFGFALFGFLASQKKENVETEKTSS